MHRRLDQWTTALSALLIVAALLACKKKTPPSTTPSAEPVAAATPIPTPPAPAPPAPSGEGVGPKLGDVKRYPDREKTQTGAARILEDGVKVFNEADDKTSDVATLDKDLLVFRLASIPDWELVEFPSGIGKVSPGWLQTKFLDVKADSKVERDAVASQAKQAVVKAPAPKTSASASAKPAASASAKPAASASAKPAASTTATASAKPARTTAPTTEKKTRTKPAASTTSK